MINFPEAYLTDNDRALWEWLLNAPKADNYPAPVYEAFLVLHGYVRLRVMEASARVRGD